MKNPLKHVAVVGFVLFALLFGSTSAIQYFAADSLRQNPLNNRTVIAELARPRGPILVDGKELAASNPVDDEYKYQRTYGGDGLSAKAYANMTGYFSIVSGTTGLERSENDLLSGTSDAMFYDRVGSWFTGQQPSGAAIDLTINAKAQRAAWEGLGDQRGAAVALNPKTGEVLAMASTPGFDPNTLATHDRSSAQDAYQRLEGAKSKPLYNRAIGGNLYPPGSTFKLITAAAALEKGDVKPDSEISAPDSLKLPQTSRSLRNAGGETCGSNGRATLKHSLTISCNTAFAQLGMDLGGKALNAQAEKFGFGKRFDMPLSVSPSTFPADANEPSLAMSAIGQYEVRATPMQMAMVAAAIANGGREMTPNLVKQVRNAKTLETIEKPSPKEFSRPISSGTADSLTDMMESVVEDGTGTAAQISGVKVAGKTGTAQHAEGGSPHAWFTSFAPADDPQVAVAVVVEDGGSAGSEASGGRVAGPIAKDIMEAVIDK
ncbi:penicillin-binding protein 2 [Brevibacterium sp. 5221]|uniref:Penicillin-binding protein 2 n=1 Tax=Brevibacterium rongguiense TaxID=2695267 RepID=A0A6N9H3F9_9MICO|nr:MULTISPECIES: penicillin-binding protein 2 [Brevibacterium]MYM18587.1 penicillin-binding protein 2 [Brevibacterium rongguiense]WAL39660.1 penicillin-binding protein 2 [Brevibacterium sp. BRM-1]